MTSNEVLSEEEEQLYDRQIRLWGLEAQRRLHNAKVLIVGLGGLGSEVVKNITLAGIHSCTLSDDMIVKKDEPKRNFLLGRNSVGANRASECVERTQDLNPRVAVSALDHLPDISSIDNYDIVICSFDPGYGAASRLEEEYNKACRDKGKQFFSCQVYGYHGFAFIDLQEHEYLVTEKVIAKKGETEEQEDVLSKKTMKFCSVDSIRNSSVMLTDKAALKKKSNMFFLKQVIDEFVMKESRAPVSEDIDTLLQIWNSFAKTNAVDELKLSATDLKLCCSPSVPSVNAILGGLVAQEIIKAITHKEEPLGNLILFDGGNSCATVDFFVPA